MSSMTMPHILPCLLMAVILAAAVGTAADAAESPLNNTFAKLDRGEPVCIVVIGNSVTYGAPAGEKRTTSFYWALADWMREHFPKGDIRLKTGIIFAIGPELQLFRMEDKVFRHKPDLVLAEFGAANGAWGPAGRAVTDPATEGYIRLLRERLPECDVVLQLGLFQTMMDWYRRGETPPTAAFLHSVGTHYGCLVSDGGRAIAERIVKGADWKEFMKDGIHPNENGYAVHSAVLRQALDEAYAAYRKRPAPVAAHVLPKATLTPRPWVRPRLVPASAAADVAGFSPADFGRFKGLVATESGAVLSFRPTAGRCVGLLLRRPKAPGGLRIMTDGVWVAMNLKNEPRAIEEDDPDRHPLFRHFFHADGLPLSFGEVRLQTLMAAEGESVELAGFLVVEDLDTP